MFVSLFGSEKDMSWLVCWQVQSKAVMINEDYKLALEFVP